ncbi:deoxyribose-phosphate aldolase [Fragilaria crotonensis]|nr:deoxyribose-phosphate aldolase [Fragilaria crotonensis]
MAILLEASNDARYGLKIANRHASTRLVIGLQCRFCIAFGRGEGGSKRKPATTVQGWSAPFRYDNIEKHLRVQHPSQWDVQWSNVHEFLCGLATWAATLMNESSENEQKDPIPPVLPHELVKLSAANFIRKIRQHAFRLEHRYTAAQIDIITDEHKILLYAYQSESVLKDGIDSLSSRSCFKEDG